MGEFDPSDPLDIDHLLSDEERAIRTGVREFVEKDVLPDVGEWYERGAFPREAMKGVAALDLTTNDAERRFLERRLTALQRA